MRFENQRNKKELSKSEHKAIIICSIFTGNNNKYINNN